MIDNGKEMQVPEVVMHAPASREVAQATLNDMDTASDFYPYIIEWGPIPDASKYTVAFPSLVAVFPISPASSLRVNLQSWSYTFPASKITDVWLSSAGLVTYDESELDTYDTLPRYEDKIHLYRIETGEEQVDRIYVWATKYPVKKAAFKTPFNLDYFKSKYVMPEYSHTWAKQTTYKRGDVIKTSAGHLWRVVVEGVADIEPDNPVDSQAIIAGVNSFGDVLSGTLKVRFVGREGYAGAWRLSSTDGMMWYFSSIAAGVMAEYLPTQVKAYVKTAIKLCIRNWVSGRVYQVGMLVAGEHTQERVWECRNPGTTGVSVPFPANASPGDTCTDNGIIWRCQGTYYNHAQWFWKDTSPTFNETKHEDSHDSYAACFIWAVCKYLDAVPNDTAWLNELSPHTGYTYAQVLKEIIYYNLLTQVDNGLTKTFQGDEAPWGGEYKTRYFMDNCESYAGLVSAIKIFTDYIPDPDYVNYLTGFRVDMLKALNNLYEPVTGAYKYEVTEDMRKAPAAAPFYPWVMSQLWAALWDVPLDVDYYMNAIAWAEGKFPQWWARNDIDNFTTLGAHLGYVKLTRSLVILHSILKRVEEHHLFTDSPEMIVSDAAFYLKLKYMAISSD